MDSINCARVLKALADDTRLKILELLFTGEFSVSEIAEHTGVEYSQASHHLGVLRNAGLVLDNKEGKFVMYKLHPVCYQNGREKKNILDFHCCSIEFGKTNFIQNKNT
ncbi:MAG: metalloregulator ArsR/SmtB family transcription factor [Deltaproteobacteria bacterium]